MEGNYEGTYGARDMCCGRFAPRRADFWGHLWWKRLRTTVSDTFNRPRGPWIAFSRATMGAMATMDVKRTARAS